ncbi:MAG: hypothetical protein AAF583_08110 [Pseudomonadota bacterium]
MYRRHKFTRMNRQILPPDAKGPAHTRTIPNERQRTKDFLRQIREENPQPGNPLDLVGRLMARIGGRQ